MALPEDHYVGLFFDDTLLAAWVYSQSQFSGDSVEDVIFECIRRCFYMYQQAGEQFNQDMKAIPDTIIFKDIENAD